MSEVTFEFDKKRVRVFIKNVRQEILNIQAGESKFRAGAMHFEKGLCGAVNRLDIFDKNPTKENLDQFIEIAKQDFGNAVGEAFINWSSGVFVKVGEDKKPVIVEKEFGLKIQDIFYECFKIARIPLDPTQMDRFRAATERMAKTFQLEISKGIGEHLKTLLERAEAKKKSTKKTVSPYDPVGQQKKRTKKK
jgi:hypothetical protein